LLIIPSCVAEFGTLNALTGPAVQALVAFLIREDRHSRVNVQD
jgi:hypothetical protein